ncbi:hypothetical protein [Nocardia brasiliensis]|uniref:hypothetical protein n=1 Tax=Nocardia brasiliensis TaxID=37326 RepID=UPI003D932551
MLRNALQLVSNPRQLYHDGTDSIRSLLNETFFERFYLDDPDVTDDEKAPLFADAASRCIGSSRSPEHTDPRITQRYLHPDIEALQNDGNLLTIHLRAPSGPQMVPNRTSSETSKPPTEVRRGFSVGLTGFEPATT